MAIDWVTEIDTLTDSIVSHLVDPANPPLTGSEFPQGYFEGKDIRLGTAPCTCQQWIQENSPFTCDMILTFKAAHSEFTLELRWKETGEIAKVFGPTVVTGRSTMTSNFANQHELLVFEAFKKVARWVQDKIDADSNMALQQQRESFIQKTIDTAQKEGKDLKVVLAEILSLDDKQEADKIKEVLSAAPVDAIGTIQE